MVGVHKNLSLFSKLLDILVYSCFEYIFPYYPPFFGFRICSAIFCSLPDNGDLCLLFTFISRRGLLILLVSQPPKQFWFY